MKGSSSCIFCGAHIVAVQRHHSTDTAVVITSLPTSWTTAVRRAVPATTPSTLQGATHFGFHGTINRVCSARRAEHHVPAVRPNYYSKTYGSSTSAVHGEDATLRQATCEASRRKEPEHAKVAGNYKTVLCFCASCDRFWLEERRRPATSQQTRPDRRQSLPPVLRVAHSRDSPASCFHEAACLLPLPRPPTDPSIGERATAATVPRHRPTAPGACRLRVPGLRRTGLLQQGALDGRLRSPLGGV